jgi:hypothetical protein
MHHGERFAIIHTHSHFKPCFSSHRIVNNATHFKTAYFANNNSVLHYCVCTRR